MKEAQTAILFPWLTRQRLALFATTLLGVSAIWTLLDESRDIPLTTPGLRMELPIPQRQEPEATGSLEDDEPAGDGIALEEWETVTVRSGQSLDTIFRQQQFDVALLHRILKLNDDTRNLPKIRPGDTFDFQRHDDGSLKRMRYAAAEDAYLVVNHQDDHLWAEIQQRQVSSEILEAEGVIQSSLFVAAKAAGISDAMTMDLANIFGWDIDFVLDIREGDRFMLIYERLYRDGEFLRDGRILAATFVNQGQHYQAIWYENGETAGYFAPDGRNMKKAFLRAPLNFAYISSGFNPRRMHPVLKRVRPHNGIDYYAPKGTPVYAAGDGTVTRSGYSAANGHHVFIKHPNGVETKYLHFTKTAVKQGQRVRQGQTIGYVGSTGLATGPHLHYEFVLNGVHRDPRTVPLPKAEPLQGELLTGFRSQAAPLLTQLSRMESASLYASRE